MRAYLLGRFAFQGRCPQCARFSLCLAHTTRPRIILAARRSRQAAQAHKLRLAQMQQNDGQGIIHERQGL
jgi:hypothetical protein